MDKHVNTLCGQNVELPNMKPGGTYSNHCSLEDEQSYFSDGVGIIHRLSFILQKFTQKMINPPQQGLVEDTRGY